MKVLSFIAASHVAYGSGKQYDEDDLQSGDCAKYRRDDTKHYSLDRSCFLSFDLRDLDKRKDEKYDEKDRRRKEAKIH